MSPPMWFLGAYEVAAGGVIADLPRTEMTAAAGRDRSGRSSALYRERRRQFPAMARRAALRHRRGVSGRRGRLHVERAAPRRRSRPRRRRASRRRWRLGARLANALAGPRCGGAGRFLFHAGRDVAQQHASPDAGVRRRGRICDGARRALQRERAAGRAARRRGCWSMQPLLYGALLVGFRHVIRVPAELRANWGFQLAWRGRDARVRRRREARRRRRPRPAGAGGPAAALRVRARAAAGAAARRPSAWPAPSCCSKR